MKPDPSDSLVLHRQLLLQLGDRLRRLRKARKLTTVEMAERAGISRMTLASVEAGDPGPSMGTYLRVMGVLGVAADLAFLAGDMVHPAQPGTAAARSHRPAPQVQIMISADSKRHQAQDLLSLVLHEKAVERVRANPELIEEAKETVNRWMKSGNAHSHTLYAEWLKILMAKKWSKVLGRSRHAQELRQASPLPTLLSKEDRESILSHVSTLKKGIVFGAEGPLP
ncbi:MULTISPECIES: helix-turn-helix domain-containing protein [Comamonadaceae]|jgi:transcriptional regulator with XRE-family HTH domain|uniref:helix-turn-helix domain-containing protein n=1 Tax=Comamonadaceae TaxID=80864 RepID=UPI000D34FE2E|nr:helix-turn-helix domain-containing protein [Acidovorax sp. 107]